MLKARAENAMEAVPFTTGDVTILLGSPFVSSARTGIDDWPSRESFFRSLRFNDSSART